MALDYGAETQRRRPFRIALLGLFAITALVLFYRYIESQSINCQQVVFHIPAAQATDDVYPLMNQAYAALAAAGIPFTGVGSTSNGLEVYVPSKEARRARVVLEGKGLKKYIKPTP